MGQLKARLFAACALVLLPLLSSDAMAFPGQLTPPTQFTAHSFEPSAGHLWNDAVGGVTLFASDAWAVLSAPARWDRGGWLRAAGVFATTGLLMVYDEEIDRAVQRNKDGPVLGAIVDVGNVFEPLGLMAHTNVYYAAGIGVGYLFGWDRLQRVSTDILFSHWIAGMYRNFAKIFIGRARPFEEKGAYHFELNGGTSFPSGHASTIFQLATVLSAHVDWTPFTWAAYAIAGCVGVQRIESRGHWASDVFFGAANGIFVAKVILREHDERGFLVVPTVGPEGDVGAAASLRF